MTTSILSWIIPAYAGSTPAGRRPRQDRPDHPRIRGEHRSVSARSCATVGSSPHTRGARPSKSATSSRSWIIPAYAGSTTSGATKGRKQRDHPRIRGEHAFMPSRRGSLFGSSPHTRGALHLQDRHDEGSGIIPAYAGSTEFWVACGYPNADHPRIRGEHPRVSLMNFDRLGSSPHTRGARDAHVGSDATYPDHPRIRGEHLSARTGCRSTSRIIPAYAGSTFRRKIGSGRRPDHPRIRGEHVGRNGGRPKNVGSSPHTRGAPIGRPSTAMLKRIIPAYAGSTRSPSRAGWTSSDHPRIRGEH